jgi:predicted DNA-binding protein
MPPTKKAVTQKARLNLTVTPLQKERLVKLNEQTDKPISSMIRRAIDAYLEIEEADLKRRK